MQQLGELQARLDEASPLLFDVEERARELHKSVEVGIDVGEVARLGRALDARVADWSRASSFLEQGKVANAFATCSGLGHSLAGHAMAAVGFSSMANRSTWKSRWDQAWSEWLQGLAWRDQVLADHGLRLSHRDAGSEGGRPTAART